MTYYISRSGQQYGPYSEADLQNMLAQGQVAATDLAWGEGMAAWTPVSEILSKGSAPAPQPPVHKPTQYEPPPEQPPALPQYQQPQPEYQPPQGGYAGGAPPAAGYGAPGYAGGYGQAVPGPTPPSLHWALVLLINWLTGIFGLVWMFIQSSFVKKIDQRSKATMWFVLSLVSLVAMVGIAAYLLVDIYHQFPEFFNRLKDHNIISNEEARIIGEYVLTKLALLIACGACPLLCFIFIMVGFFSERSSIQQYYNSVEPIGLRLSAVMTFFFNIYYFQYHFSRIERWKRTGQLY